MSLLFRTLHANEELSTYFSQSHSRDAFNKAAEAMGAKVEIFRLKFAASP